MALTDLLDQTATHKRPTVAKDAIGGAIQTFATQNASVAVALWPANQRLAYEFMRRDILGDHVIVAASDLNVKPNDIFIIGSDTYTVIGDNLFANSSFDNEVVYAIDVQKRTVN